MHYDKYVGVNEKQYKNRFWKIRKDQPFLNIRVTQTIFRTFRKVKG